MKTWWTERNERERLLIIAALGLTLLLALWQFLLVPVSDYHAEAKRAYVAAQARLDDMQRAAGEAVALKARQSEAQDSQEPQSARAVATSSARARGIVVTRLQPSDDGSLTLWIDATDASLLYAWMVDLQNDYGISVTKASLSANDGAATVRAQLRLAGRDAATP